MEKPLLSGESSGHARSDGRSASFRRRSDAIAYGSPYQKAAALVDLAEDGIGLPEELLEKSNFQSVAKLYFFYTQLDFIWSLNYFALVILNFLEGITLVILIVHTFFPLSYEGARIYWKRPLNQFKVFCLLILVADLLFYILYLSPAALDSLPFRIAPYIRVVFFILNIRELRSSSVILAGMLGTYLNVMALSALFLLFASWVAYVMFEDTQQGKTLFTSYGTTLYQMFVLFTTSNNPDVWIPAYKVSRWYCLYFVLYVLLGVYFVTNLILAVVYDSFKGELAKQVSEMDEMRKRTLEKAFNLLDKDYIYRKWVLIFVRLQNRKYIKKEECIELFKELNKYRTLPKITKEEFELIFDELDDSGDFKINLDEFTDLCNAIALRFQKEDTPSFFEYCPSFYHSRISENLKAFIRSPKFGYIISFILIVNLVTVIIETTLDIENNSAQKVWQGLEFVFGWIYVLEMALKIYAYGFENYWRDGQNQFDFLITWIIVIGETVTFASPQGSILSNGEWYETVDSIPSSCKNVAIDKAAVVRPALQSLHSNILNSHTEFDAISRDTILCPIFGGMVNAGNPKLEATDLSDDDYLLFNFNDYPNGMVTLFNLLVMGNWQVWMQSYKDLTGTSWTLVYFISFYLLTVLLLLNLVIAFVLEAFFAELDLESSERGEERDKVNNYVKESTEKIERVESGRLPVVFNANIQQNNALENLLLNNNYVTKVK
ncbi:Two pore calcium channel protein 1 [Morus notabilis]|uniref:Two pore calcium channel protein 1 n=1 Tax=Morus notabilis TaxID=981085 RepID=W9R4H1_9ROSA|nr:Two pore calcium channel protein 1 [Morus notabilis]